MTSISGREIIDSAMHSLGLDKEASTVEQRLDRLGELIGYASRTLRGIYYGEVPVSKKFQKWITKYVDEAAAAPTKYTRLIRHSDAQTKRIERSAFISHTSADHELVDQLRHLLDDFEAAKSAVTQDFLADEIRKLTASLRAPEKKPEKPKT